VSPALIVDRGGTSGGRGGALEKGSTTSILMKWYKRRKLEECMKWNKSFRIGIRRLYSMP
jgi:hypothetical protein